MVEVVGNLLDLLEDCLGGALAHFEIGVVFAGLLLQPRLAENFMMPMKLVARFGRDILHVEPDGGGIFLVHPAQQRRRIGWHRFEQVGSIGENGPTALLRDANRALRAVDLERAVALVGRRRSGSEPSKAFKSVEPMKADELRLPGGVEHHGHADRLRFVETFDLRRGCLELLRQARAYR